MHQPPLGPPPAGGSAPDPGEYAGPPPTEPPSFTASDAQQYDVVSPHYGPPQHPATDYPAPGYPAPDYPAHDYAAAQHSAPYPATAAMHGPHQYGSPPPWAGSQPPTKKRSTALMITAAAIAFVVMLGTVLVILLRDTKPSAQSTTTTAPQGAPDSLTADRIEQELQAASDYVDGELVQTFTLSTDEATFFSTCADDVTLQNYTITSSGVTDDGTDETDLCMAGFDPAEIDPAGIVMAIEDATGGAKLPVTVEIFGGNTYTPVLLVTVDGGYPAAYAADGSLLDLPINPLVAEQRDEAFATIIEESGIDQLTAYCADIEYSAIYVEGSSAKEPDTIQAWSFTALPQQIDTYPEFDELRFGPDEYDLQTYIDHAPNLDPKYTEDGASLAMVCVTTEYDDQQPVAGYYFSSGPESDAYEHTVYLSLQDFSLIYED